MEMMIFLLLIVTVAILMSRSRPGKAAYRALAAMAAELGAELVCEGIETEEEA